MALGRLGLTSKCASLVGDKIKLRGILLMSNQPTNLLTYLLTCILCVKCTKTNPNSGSCKCKVHYKTKTVKNILSNMKKINSTCLKRAVQTH